MNDWIDSLAALLAAGHAVVRVVVATLRGSVPREPGATLLFWRDADGTAHSRGSIGGGHLEARAMEIAGALLGEATAGRRIERFALGASLGQCCGGSVELYWERFDTQLQAQGLVSAPGLLRYCVVDGSDFGLVVGAGQARARGLPLPDFAGRAGLLEHAGRTYFVERLTDDSTPLWIYGAGHVGQALAHVLADLPFRITWIDSREATLTAAMADLSPRRASVVQAVATDEPAVEAVVAPAGAWHLVMTHSHDQDLSICESLLRTGRFGFLGLIGSRTKDARFRQRLLHKGCSAAAVARIVCPIGAPGVCSKLPAAIAVAVAAQLLELRELLAEGASPLPVLPFFEGVPSP